VKRKIVYVTRVLEAPTDSHATPYLFIRGTANVCDEVENIRYNTGGLIDYVGEWHTHPSGSSSPSERDMKTVHSLRKLFDAVPYPTFMLIGSKTNVHPYIFGPTGLI